MKYILLLMIFSSLILANDVNKEMLESCKELVKDKTQTNNKMFESCNKILKTEKIKEENKRTYRLRVKLAALYQNRFYADTYTASFEYLFYGKFSIGSSLGIFSYNCQKVGGLFSSQEDKETCIEGELDYKQFYGDIYLSINFLENYKYFRTGFTGGIGFAPRDEYYNKNTYKPFLFIKYFLGIKLWNLIDLTASIGIGEVFTLQAGINF